jgi:hypothetical protein
MRIVPIYQKEAKIFVEKIHEHHRAPIGAIFSIGLKKGDDLIGVAMCGRPVARKINHKEVIEVLRNCVKRGNPNACSKLYGASARIAKEMGYKKIITYVLESETGVSLKAAGWFEEESNAGGAFWNSSGDRIRTDVVRDLFGETKKYPNEKKKRFAKILNN